MNLMDHFVRTYADWISFCGVVFTVIGFILTVRQLYSVKKKVKDVEQATKTRIENTLTLVVVVEMLQLVNSIHDNLQAEEWGKSIGKMSSLHMSLSGIISHEIVKKYSREDFRKCVSQIPSDLSILRNYKKSIPTQAQVRSMERNLDTLVENLKLVEQKLK